MFLKLLNKAFNKVCISSLLKPRYKYLSLFLIVFCDRVTFHAVCSEVRVLDMSQAQTPPSCRVDIVQRYILLQRCFSTFKAPGQDD